MTRVTALILAFPVRKAAAFVVATIYGALWSPYRAGTILVAASIIVSVVSSCASLPHNEPERARMRVEMVNHYRDPVDVSIYCGGGRVGKVRWLMRSNTESVYVRAGHGCALRFTIEPSITGGPYAYTPRFNSASDYESLNVEPAICITVGSLVTNSGAIQGKCLR